ncbi:hypothetical protein A2U01_0059182 [Trifolium medium]|uniref:Uncharacterized protein n=1 Tax=Trifolium medium TaxID=97028 RepID=A0A392RQV1_9FABA|nr:hypothetical protein [Trifolium medium]
MAGNASDDNTVVISQTDESMNTVSENLEDDVSAEKDKEADLNVIDVDNIDSRKGLLRRLLLPALQRD